MHLHVLTCHVQMSVANGPLGALGFWWKKPRNALRCRGAGLRRSVCGPQSPSLRIERGCSHLLHYVNCYPEPLTPKCFLPTGPLDVAFARELVQRLSPKQKTHRLREGASLSKRVQALVPKPSHGNQGNRALTQGPISRHMRTAYHLS